jgi:hypothetical protein
MDVDERFYITQRKIGNKFASYNYKVDLPIKGIYICMHNML